MNFPHKLTFRFIQRIRLAFKFVILYVEIGHSFKLVKIRLCIDSKKCPRHLAPGRSVIQDSLHLKSDRENLQIIQFLNREYTQEGIPHIQLFTVMGSVMGKNSGTDR